MHDLSQQPYVSIDEGIAIDVRGGVGEEGRSGEGGEGLEGRIGYN